MSHIPYKVKLVRAGRLVPGVRPGAIQVPADARQTVVTLYIYNSKEVKEYHPEVLDQLLSLLDKHKKDWHWVDIRGLRNLSLIETVGQRLGCSNLDLEDMYNTTQRPKLEVNDSYLFMVARMIFQNNEQKLQNEQIAFLNDHRTLVTIQEYEQDCLESVRERLRGLGKNMLAIGPDYLMYALMDCIIDHYYPVLSNVSQDLDQLEEKIISKPNSALIQEIQNQNRLILDLKKGIIPVKETIRILSALPQDKFSSKVAPFLRDLVDHAVQVGEFAETLKEHAASLFNLFTTFMGHKTNEVTRVLTVVASIFIPITFIAGIYGMNFAPENPNNGESYPWNMPELYQPYGYLMALGLMAAVTLLMIFIFIRKKWL